MEREISGDLDTSIFRSVKRRDHITSPIWRLHPDHNRPKFNFSWISLHAALMRPVLAVVVSKVFLNILSLQFHFSNKLPVSSEIICPVFLLVPGLYAGIPKTFVESSDLTNTANLSSWTFGLFSKTTCLESQRRVHNSGGTHSVFKSSAIMLLTWRLNLWVVAYDEATFDTSSPDFGNNTSVNAACCHGVIFLHVARETNFERFKISWGMKSSVWVFFC